MLALKNQCWKAKQKQRKGVPSCCQHYIHNGISSSSTKFFVALATSLIASIGGIGLLFYPQFSFAQSANVEQAPTLAVADPSSASASSSINLNTSAPLAVVAPVTIGNQFYQERGAVTTQRVTDVDVSNGPIFENSYVAHGMLRGSIPVTNIGTIKVTIRPGSVSFGEGQGVITNVNGDMATWTSHGLGHLSQGKVIVIGSVILKTSSTGNLAFLNNMVGAFRQIVDQSNGNVDSKVWELR
jgi:hypothetical protein